MVEKVSSIKTYQWDAPSLITRIDVRAQDKNGAVAYIYPPENAQEHAPKLLALRDRFKQMGWATNSDNRYGKSVLRVSGLANENELLALLQTGNHIMGAARISTTANNSHEGLGDSLRSNSLRASGIFYTLGNILFIISGIRRKDNDQIGTGVSFAVGDSLLTAFGGKDDRRQFKSLLTKLTKHLEEKGIAIPEGAAITAETMAAKGGFLETVYDYMHEHINGFKILAEIAGGVYYFRAGLNQHNPRKQAAAAVIVAGWTAALLIKEKKPDKEKLQNAGSLEKAWAYIQEKPLRLAGWAGLTHNALSTWGAFEERRDQLAQPNGTRHYQWDMAGIAAMLLGNSLYSISNKVTGGSIETGALVEDVYGLAAQVLNRQPPELRQKAIEATADFLGERTELKDSRSQIIEHLRKEMEALSHNPWFYPREQTAQTPGLNRR